MRTCSALDSQLLKRILEGEMHTAEARGRKPNRLGLFVLPKRKEIFSHKALNGLPLPTCAKRQKGLLSFALAHLYTPEKPCNGRRYAVARLLLAGRLFFFWLIGPLNSGESEGRMVWDCVGILSRLSSN